MPGNFFDTNVLVYLVSADLLKADRAGALVRGGGVIGVQVLNELANVARRKMHLSWSDTHHFLATIRALLPVRPMTPETHILGMTLAERYGLSVYDSLIVAAALEADCTTLWSEDMQHGMVLNGSLHIANPFHAS